jgi:hypothetical protein
MPSAQNSSLLPPTVPLSTAAILSGLSFASFKARAIDSGIVTIDDGKVRLSSLAAWLGKPISVAEYLQAERRRDPARKRQRQWRKERQR